MADDSASEDEIIVISAIVTKLKEDRSKKGVNDQQGSSRGLKKDPQQEFIRRFS